MTRVQEQPVPIVALIVVLINAVILALIGFGIINWTGEQVGLFMGVVNAAAAIASWLILNRLTTPLAAPKDRSGEALVTRAQALNDVADVMEGAVDG